MASDGTDQCVSCDDVVPEDAPMRVERAAGVFCDPVCAVDWFQNDREEETGTDRDGGDA